MADAVPVPLADEVAFTRSYLKIEQARFGDRLEVAWHVDSHSLAVRVPGLVLQPLLENGAGHGPAVAASTSPRRSRIRCCVSMSLTTGSVSPTTEST